MASNKETKNLKSKLDGDTLDLSLSDLSVVPVREIAALKKVAYLDLSSNHIVTLPDDFFTLKNLVKLDLSSNKLRSLPENFGKLENLQHLDLYKNNLETLPVSFCHLKHLRWLDLKDNPLDDRLRKVAGDCLDPKQCKEAATKIVQYMQRINSDRERERQKELKKQRDLQEAEKAKEVEIKQAKAVEKKKEKERRKETKQARDVTNSKERKIDNESKPPAQKDRGVQKQERAAKKRKSRGVLGWLWCLLSIIMFTAFLVTLLLVGLIFTLYYNCSRPAGKEFIPESHELCQELYMMMQSGRISSLKWDYNKSWRGSTEAFHRFSNSAVDTVQQFDYVGWKNSIIETVLIFRDTVVQLALWTYENGWEMAKPMMKQLIEWFWLAADWTGWILEHAFQYAIRAGKWTIETTSDMVNNFPAYWEKVKFYWNNMK